MKYEHEYPIAQSPENKDLSWIAKEQANQIKAYPGLWEVLEEEEKCAK